MLKLHFAGPEPQLMPEFIPLTGSSTSIGTTVDAIRSNDLDALLFSSEWAHPLRTVRSALPPSSVPSFIAVHHRVSRASMAHALACGFDGVVSMSDDPRSTLDKIAKIIDGTWTFESEPWLRELGLRRGMLARELVLDDTSDEQLVDLVGTGLPDEDIAMLMDWTIQQVRNRIENLLTDNNLAYRTQLAVIRAASLKVPDFF